MNEFEGFAIPSHESERIEDIASQIPGLFFSRREFVNEAISYYISIWGNPEKAYAKFLSFLPFMKQKTLKRVKGLMNPNEFEKMLQESQIKYKRLENSPEKVNLSPYGDGWLIKISPENPKEKESLLTNVSYQKSIE